MKFLVKTYGCRMNERDGEAAAALLARHGHSQVRSEAEADVVIVNTCSVRAKAEDKALGKLGLLVAAGKSDPGKLVGAMGCMAQRLGAEIFELVPGLAFAVGTHRLANLPAVLELAAGGRGPVLDAAPARPPFDEELALRRHGKVSALVNILIGCNRRCSFCIVPAVRGPEWSRAANDVLAEVREAAARGAREVSLLGQSVMAYGLRNEVWPQDHVSARGFKAPFQRLLEAVNEVEGLARIRFSSGHPSGCSAELARAMTELDKVCGHLHLPMQSGSDRILRLMRRGYTADSYRRAVARLRNAAPDIAVTTDIIVGFPSETAGEFDMTLRLMREIGFDNAFVFKYSPRPGTAAGRLNDDVPREEKERRNRVLLEEQAESSARINAKLAGRTVEALAEGPSERNPKRWFGRTRANKIAVFDPSPGVEAGDLVQVEIERTTAATLYGKASGG